MWEKLKDFLYEISDILFALLIIFVMSVVITWKITDSMAFSKNKNSFPTQNQTSVHMEHSKNTSSDKTDVSEKTEPEEENADNPSPSQSDEPIQINIPSGIPAANIATILEENNLIQSASDFIARIEERQLANQLKFGTFQFKQGSSLDEIIDILTGQH
ncbi:MAG TPA: endolytic transglycosylase MltG [Clostridiales bacterium]|nr:endolytic transglycosylase MltG [Clostridiales bacterium]